MSELNLSPPAQDALIALTDLAVSKNRDPTVAEVMKQLGHRYSEAQVHFALEECFERGFASKPPFRSDRTARFSITDVAFVKVAEMVHRLKN